jgi:hypothetical protein
MLVSLPFAVEFEIDFRDGDGPVDVEIALSGLPTPEAFAVFTRSLASDTRFRAGLTMLVDCTALDTSGVSDDALETLSAPMVEGNWRYPPKAIAVIAPDEETYNTALRHRAHLGGSTSNRSLFRSRAEAVAWLEAGASDPNTAR